MTRARSINSYQDIKLQLEEIRAMGGAEIDLGSYGAAITWVARVYTYRSLLRAQAKIGMPEGVDPSTPWDDLIIHHNKRNRATSVEVEFGILKKGVIKPLSAGRKRARQVVDELPVQPIVQDDLLALAQAEVEEKGKKE